MPNHMADANLEVDPIDSDGEKDECFVKTVSEPEHFFDLGDDFFDGRLMKRQTTLFRKAFQITSYNTRRNREKIPNHYSE